MIFISGNILSNIDITYYAQIMNLKNFRGCFMRDQLFEKPLNDTECGVMNLNLASQHGEHWICWYISKYGQRFVFDSFGMNIPYELISYLNQNDDNKPIRRNDIVVQHYNTTECGRLCLFVLKSLNDDILFDDILQVLKIRYDRNV